MKYVVVLYKPNSYSYCRNCLMDSYSSDCQILILNSKKELDIKLKEVKEYKYEPDEDPYQITVINGGKVVFEI